jgi:hypothetical protein
MRSGAIPKKVEVENDHQGIAEEEEEGERARLRHRFRDAMWFPFLSPFKCRTQSKTHGAVIPVPTVEEAGRYLFGFLCR